MHIVWPAVQLIRELFHTSHEIKLLSDKSLLTGINTSMTLLFSLLYSRNIEGETFSWEDVLYVKQNLLMNKRFLLADSLRLKLNSPKKDQLKFFA